MKRNLLFTITFLLAALSISAQSYIDLGLPRGTLWKNVNEKGYYCELDATIDNFEMDLPTYDQFKELTEYCRLIWRENGCLVVGENGESIFLPADGVVERKNGPIEEVGEAGYYLTRDVYAIGDIDLSKVSSKWMFSFNSRSYGLIGSACSWYSVRLVKNTH